jgi:ClpP class serine protease
LITANNKAARIGSIGTAATFHIDENKITVTNTDSPNKRPDLTTEKGKAVIRQELDDMQELFVESVANGRNTSEKDVIKNYGQGGVFLAEEALKRGMIDAIEDVTPNNNKTNEPINSRDIGGENMEAKEMNLTDLKAKYPLVHAEAVAEGTAKELDRVSAHLIMGEKSGAMDAAVKAVKEGAEMTSTMQATYMTAGMNRTDVVSKGDDDKDVEKVLKGADSKVDDGDASSEVLSKVQSGLGFIPKA